MKCKCQLGGPSAFRPPDNWSVFVFAARNNIGNLIDDVAAGRIDFVVHSGALSGLGQWDYRV